MLFYDDALDKSTLSIYLSITKKSVLIGIKYWFAAHSCIVFLQMWFVDPMSVQNYLMSWLHESAADSEQLHLLFPQSNGNQSGMQ